MSKWRLTISRARVVASLKSLRDGQPHPLRFHEGRSATEHITTATILRFLHKWGMAELVSRIADGGDPSSDWLASAMDLLRPISDSSIEAICRRRRESWAARRPSQKLHCAFPIKSHCRLRATCYAAIPALVGCSLMYK